jgi:hypothetical protein
MKFLSLQSNGFSGSIPPHLYHLKHIMISDLSLNNISEIIPRYLSNLTSIIWKTVCENSITSNGANLEW